MAENENKALADQMRALSAWLLGERRGEHIEINRGQASKALLTAAAQLDPVTPPHGVAPSASALELSREEADELMERMGNSFSKASDARELAQAAFRRGVKAARGVGGTDGR